MKKNSFSCSSGNRHYNSLVDIRDQSSLYHLWRLPFANGVTPASHFSSQGHSFLIRKRKMLEKLPYSTCCLNSSRSVQTSVQLLTSLSRALCTSSPSLPALCLVGFFMIQAEDKIMSCQKSIFKVM